MIGISPQRKAAQTASRIASVLAQRKSGIA
jgi:hypothetical protein